MNINQQNIDSEKCLIERVIDFSLSLKRHSICFNNIADKLELDLSVSEEFLNETLEAEQLKQLADKVVEFDEEIKKWERVRDSEEWQNFDSIGRLQLYNTFPWRKKYPKQDFVDYIGMLIDLKAETEMIIEKNGKIITPLLGSFSSDENKIYLYLKNIESSACQWRSNKAILTEPLITTFIHEMFHAWNYFTCGEKDRTVKEIDEAMVEFATLYFLKQISSNYPEFEPILKWAERNVKSKQKSIGSIAAYGYGYYLYSLTENKEPSHAIELLEAYIRASGRMTPSGLTNKIIVRLNPNYPIEEDEVYQNLKLLLLDNCKVRGQVWSKSGKTNIVTRDNSLLFEENVNNITRLEVGNVSSNMYLIEDEGLFKIYREKQDKWFPVFDEDFDEVKSIKYGKHYIIFVKRHSDGNIFLLSPLDIRRIIDTPDKIVLENCMSAEEFTAREDDNENELYIYSKTKNKFYYIFPFYGLQSRIVDDVDPTIEAYGGHKYQVPRIFHFTSCGQKFVYIVKNEKAYIYHIEGKLIGKYDLFVIPVPNNDKYALIKQKEKFNYFSFEKMDVLYNRWFEDCDEPNVVNEEWIFRVKENGVYKILDIKGNNISDQYRDVLNQWIEELKENMG